MNARFIVLWFARRVQKARRPFFASVCFLAAGCGVASADIVPTPADQRGKLDNVSGHEGEAYWAAVEAHNSGGGVVSVGIPSVKWDKLVVTVAFNGGNPAIHKLIADTANEWIVQSKVKNLKFDFGLGGPSGYRTWSKGDSVPAADIRIGFDGFGYSSALGIIARLYPAGAMTMSLGGFDQLDTAKYQQDPASWKVSYYNHVVLHEFGHALGLMHEQLHAKCVSEFHFEPDNGYENTFVDPQFRLAKDAAFTHRNGISPGLYKYYSGAPNNWSVRTTDHQFNLKSYLANTRSGALQANVTGAILPDGSKYPDRISVMLYDLEPFLLRSGKNSPCYTPGFATKLSPEDLKFIAKIYR